MRVAILCEKGFEAMELMYPYYRFIEEAYNVDIVAPEKKTYTAYNGYSTKSTLTFAKAVKYHYDAIIIPGGKAPLRLAKHKLALKMISKVASQGGVIAAICHGPLVFTMIPDILKESTLTGYPSIESTILDAGAKDFVDEPVMVDIHKGYILVTSRTPDDLPFFCSTIIEVLGLNAK